MHARRSASMAACSGMPLIFSYSAAMRACERAGQLDIALELLSEMKVSGVAPNQYSYHACVAACNRAGDWVRALELLDEMKADDPLAALETDPLPPRPRRGRRLL